jgi:anthranilate phosphoribosyltransferase
MKPPDDSPDTVRRLLTVLIEVRELSTGDAGQLFERLFDGRLSDGEAAALLVALRMKGETAGELASAAAALRARMVAFPTGSAEVLDTCGTGGDGARTFNISTGVAFVAAGAGVRVVKHGNRAVSGRSGSADVLRELGLPAEAGPDWAARCLREAGLAFCFAPHFHPALTRLADLRQRLGVRTILNSLGPLANPAGAAYQLIGVGRVEMLDPMADALAVLGVRHAIVVCGADGFDEVSLMGPTLVREVRGNTVMTAAWTPVDFRLEPCQLADLQASGPTESAATVRDVLTDHPGPARRIVVANAAAALLAADRVSTLREGVALADETISSRRAADVLERLRGVGVAHEP